MMRSVSSTPRCRSSPSAAAARRAARDAAEAAPSQPPASILLTDCTVDITPPIAALHVRLGFLFESSDEPIDRLLVLRSAAHLGVARWRVTYVRVVQR